MWVMTTGGFVSIVQKPDDVKHDLLTVRARDWQSLEFMRATVELVGGVSDRGLSAEVLEEEHVGTIVGGEGSDYEYRVRFPRSAVSDWLAWEVAEMVKYDNFKNQVKTDLGDRWGNVYSSIWVDLLPIGRFDEVDGEDIPEWAIADEWHNA